MLLCPVKIGKQSSSPETSSYLAIGQPALALAFCLELGTSPASNTTLKLRMFDENP